MTFDPAPPNALRAALLSIAAVLLSSAPAHADTASGKPMFGQWGVETQHFAPEIKAGDDFYRHVNKGWLDRKSVV